MNEPSDIRRAPSRDAANLAVASLTSGVLAYVVFAVVTRALGPDGAAPVAVVWTWWSLTAAAITFPIQHWITRAVALHGGFRAARSVLPLVALIIIVLAGVTGLAAWMLRRQLFADDGFAFPLSIVALTLGAALMGLVRGGLGARERFGSLALTMLAENGARCAGVSALWALNVKAPAAYGAVIVTALMAAFLWPRALMFPGSGDTLAGGRRAAVSLLTGASSGQLLAQTVLTVGPVVLAVIGGAPRDITVLFLGLAVYRAPYIVAIGVVPQLTGRLTRLVDQGHREELARVRRALATLTLGAAAGAVGIGWWIGPPLIRAVFGPDVDLPVDTSVLLAVGSVFAVGTLIASVLVIATGRTRWSTAAWLAGIGGGASVLVTDLNALDRIAVAFLVAHVLAFVVLLAASLEREKG